jgi:hypothetical protein
VAGYLIQQEISLLFKLILTIAKFVKTGAGDNVRRDAACHALFFFVIRYSLEHKGYFCPVRAVKTAKISRAEKEMQGGRYLKSIAYQRTGK